MLSLMDRAAVGVHADHALYGLAILLFGGEVQGLLDPLDHEHLVFGLYLPDGVGVEAFEGNLTRCQKVPSSQAPAAATRESRVAACGSTSSGEAP